MKIYSKKHQNLQIKAKITSFDDHWTIGINRRTFIKGSIASSLLASIAGCKPSVDVYGETDKVAEKQLINQSSDIIALSDHRFSHKQHIDLQSVYMRLFPDDGDGPSANDLNVLTYLEWAMTDQQNKDDGDPEFIIKGLGWLNQFANDDHGKDFVELDTKTQDEIINTTAKSDAGRNWLSILIYYLIEALTLDPFYGGNTNGIGWQWLEYQGGFPHPITGKTYRDFK